MNGMERAVNLPILCPKIIGRTPEFAALGLLVEQAKEGQGHIALIAGEAGIGKSRLVSELKALAVVQGFLVVQGACFPTDLTYPYAPLLDLLRSLVASNPKASLTAAVETLARDIFPLLPELVPGQTTPLPRLEPEQEKHRLFAVLATFFLHLSTQSPVLLVIEDAHWSDDTSLDFLHYLTRRSASQPLLLLVTYRHDEMQPELRSWLAQLDRERLAHEIRLVPLARNEVDTMLSAIFEERHTSFDMRRFLHGELLDTLYTLTEGNPFFVEETLSSLIAAGDIFYVQGFWNRKSGSEVSIPQSVQDAVQRRTARVGEAARHVLTLAAVAGRVGVGGAHDALQLREHARCFLGAGRDEAEGADALAVERERFRERARQEYRRHRAGEEARGERIGFQPVAEALVGEIQKGNQSAPLHDAEHLRPVFGREVDAGRVVAAGVQHDDRAGGKRVERASHAGKVEAVRARIVVGIVAHREPGGFEELPVVLPARLADPDFRIRADALEEIGADLQAAGAANRLHRDGVLVFRAKDELLHGTVIGGEAVDRQVVARRRGLEALALRAPHAFEERHLAVVVGVDADAEVHLPGVFVGEERLRDAEDRIARRHRHLSEQGGGMRSVHRLKW